MKKFLMLTLAILLGTNLYAQKQLTLDEALSIALQRNSSLIKTKNNILTNESQLKSAYGDLIPTLGVRGDWSWRKTEDDGGGLLPNVFGILEEQEASEFDTRNYSVSAGGNVILFDGLANIANISQKKDDLESAELYLEKVKQDIIFETTDLYYTILNAQELLKVREDNVTFNGKFLEQVQERNKLGSVAIADVYAQQVQLGNAELLQIQAENSLEQAKSTFLNFLALDVLEEYEFVDPIDSDAILNTDTYMDQFDDISTMVEKAYENRLDYQSQQLVVESANSGVTIAQGGLFPSLSGDYGFFSEASILSDMFNRRIWRAGLTLNFPIFSNWNTENSIQFAKVNVMNAEEDLNALERQIKIEIKQGYLDLVAAKKGLDVSLNNITSAEENRRINNERYNLGSGTILDVLQADRDYTQAARDKIETQYSFFKFKDRLLNFLGMLDYKKYE